jgi:DNA-binding NtrC family response regulator
MPSHSSTTTPRRIVVVDDDRRLASSRAEWLCGLGWHAFAVGSLAEAVRSPGRDRCTACLIDAHLPDDGGHRVAEAVRGVSPSAGIVAIVAPGDACPPWADAAACHPGADTDLLAAIEVACTGASDRIASCSALRSTSLPTPCGPGSAMIGSHPALLHAADIARRIAQTPATVLVTGESGTGKTLLARDIHVASRRTGRFVEVACGSLAEPLLESELFGHVAGAFTGASVDRDGRFLEADGGTIFLDEIATASPALQVKLLRVLQEMEFEPVGSGRTHRVDARVVLATNEDLEPLVAAGRFRADLFWRINVVAIEMPPLRARPSDIPLLADHFLRKAATHAGRDVTGFSEAAITAICAHAWPGNVRELQHAVERAVFLGRGNVVDVTDLPPAVLAGARSLAPAASPLKEALASPERQLILEALERSGWRRDLAARSLGINRTTLYKKLRRLGLDLADLQATR